MADTQAHGPELTDDDALRQRLLRRIAVAAVVIVGLLGSLAIFDALYAPRTGAPVKIAELPAAPPAAEAPAPATPAAGEEKKPAQADAAADAAKPAEAPGTAATPDSKPEPPVVAATPEGTSATGAPPLQPLPPERGLTRPATGKPASIRPSEPVLAPLAPRPDAQREIARAPSRAHGAPASRPITQAAERQFFAIQLGVFSNLANAEELRAKLELAGVPASIEARVRAGPFASRAEAEEARAKLRAIGLVDGIMVSVKR